MTLPKVATRRIFLHPLLLLFCVLLLPVKAGQIASDYGSAAAMPAIDSDGPYLHYTAQPGQLTVRWMCQGVAYEQQYAATQPIPVRCGYQHPIQLATAEQHGHHSQQFAVPPWQFKARRIAAISDIHGQYDLMLRLLKAAQVLDATGHWQFGNGHLVLVGDVMDRGAGVTQSFWHLYQLQQQAKTAGGAVHLLPGNHETMVMRGDFRYLHPLYQQVSQVLGLNQQQLYGDDSVLGQWLRRQPLFVRINDTLFIHGGLSPTLAKLALPPEHVLTQFQQSIGKSKSALQDQPVQAMLQGSDGPLWYRGFFRTNSDFQPDGLRRQLKLFGASRVVVGHTTMDQIYQHHQGLVLSTDSDIKDGEQGEVLHFADGQWFRTGLDGRMKSLVDGQHWHKTTKDK